MNSVTLFLASEKVCYNKSMGHLWTPDPRGEGRVSCIRVSLLEGKKLGPRSPPQLFLHELVSSLKTAWDESPAGHLVVSTGWVIAGPVTYKSHANMWVNEVMCRFHLKKKNKKFYWKNISVRRLLGLMISKVILTNQPAVHDSTHPGLYETIHLRLHLRAGAGWIVVDPQFASRFLLVQL